LAEMRMPSSVKSTPQPMPQRSRELKLSEWNTVPICCLKKIGPVTYRAHFSFEAQ
jgi:hypothetical protein